MAQVSPYETDIMIEELKTEKKFSKGIYMLDFFALVLSVAFGYYTKWIVPSAVQFLYVIGVVLIVVYLTRVSKNNPKKRNLFGLVFLFSRKMESVYQAEPYETDMIKEAMDGITE